MQSYFSLVKTQEELQISDVTKLLMNGLITLAITVVPIALIASLFSIIPTIAQTKMLFSFKSIQPKLSKLNPITGLKKMFSLKSVIELLKACIKIIILIAVIYITLKKQINPLVGMMDMSIKQAASFTGKLLFGLIKNTAIAFVFLSLFDYLYQRWDFEKNLRMTKQEVKEEYKQTEGDPQIKGKIRQIQRQRAMNRMMKAVPEADVIIRNPTHYAVALKYDSKKSNAPIVVAKGADYVAIKIIDIAKKHDIVEVENKPLARALYDSVKIGMEIPQEYYHAVADVLAFVYSVKKKEMK
jgi:flagellar biosynthetic protein FlhB